MASVERISTTVVKGTSLDHPARITVGEHGYARDRLFHFIDEHGVMLSSKRFGPLIKLKSDYDDEANRLSISFPDGETVSAEVQLTDETVSTNFWGRPVGGIVVDGPFASAVGAYVGRTVRMVRAEVPGTATDLHPVTIVSTATLDFFAKKYDGPLEHWRDRFRMLVEIADLEPFEEESWSGRDVAIGDLVVSVLGSVPRCLVTQHNPRTGVKNFDTLKKLRLLRTQTTETQFPPKEDDPVYGGFLLGMYAAVSRPGDVAQGDAVRVLSRAG